MKVLYKNARILSILLAFMFLLQSCHVYRKAPIGLDNAVAANKRMKVITTDGKKHKFIRIQKSDSIYYGLAFVRNQRVKVPLHTDKIQSIHPVNIEGSVLLTAGAITLPIVALLGIAISETAKSLGDMDFSETNITW